MTAVKCFRCNRWPCTCPDGQTVIVGDCREVLRQLPSESVDAVVTDPPYGLEFMGKEWDHGVPGVEFWTEAIRVAKPGAHLLAFGGTRTFHRLASAIEDAGWEIRDCIMWVYGSGFPKSLDVSKAIDKEAGAARPAVGSKRTNVGMQGGNFANQSRSGDVDVTAAATAAAAAAWDGWGTALKPAWEPIIVARKPLAGTVAKNVQTHGTGALNIDDCRIPFETEADRLSATPQGKATSQSGCLAGKLQGAMAERSEFTPRGRSGEASANRRYTDAGGTNFAATPGPRGGDDRGRWPANVIHDGSAEVVELFPQVESGEPAGIKAGGKLNCYSEFAGGIPVTGYGDAGSAARFFYCAKASGSDRGAWNTHPTVKPTELMAYLVKLVAPVGATVLDPFGGSGTTLQVARKNGCRGIGIELNPEYAKLIAKRLEQRTLFTEQLA